MVFSEKLPHRSLLPVAFEQNAAFYHWVPKEDSEGERWSLIFRTIKPETKRKATKRKASEAMTKSELRGIFANELLSRESVWRKSSKRQIAYLQKAAKGV